MLAERVKVIFQSQYPTGQDFIHALEGNRQAMLDAIASVYPSPEKRYVASIEGDKLVLKLVSSPDSGGKALNIGLYGNDIYAIGIMAFLLGNYLHAKGSVDFSKPVALEGTIDEKTDPMGIRNGTPPMEEFVDIFKGNKNAGETAKYITIDFIIMDKN